MPWGPSSSSGEEGLAYESAILHFSRWIILGSVSCAFQKVLVVLRPFCPHPVQSEQRYIDTGFLSPTVLLTRASWDSADR